MLRAVQMENTSDRPWWGEGIEDLVHARGPHPGGAPHAWTFAAPRVDPTLHMPWLLSKLKHPIERRRLDTLDEVKRLPGHVINCTGLGARTLVNDPRVTPLYGQVVVAEPDGLDPTLTISDERTSGEVFYIIPRRAEVIIGGCTLPWDRPFGDGVLPEPDPALTEQILARAARYGFVPRSIRRIAAGLRPFRDEVRVERDATHPNLIHNYGHGGSGYTIAWGCAQDVVRMVEA
jgi:D-amino-acid oxidase